jgi:TusE/DsrC/DsvC family sulfur relay protein
MAGLWQTDLIGGMINKHDRRFAYRIFRYFIVTNAEEDIELDAAYRPILRVMHNYRSQHRVAPNVRHVVDFLVMEQGFEKKRAKQHLFRLFPYGYVQQACKIAGMQRLRAWSTG